MKNIFVKDVDIKKAISDFLSDYSLDNEIVLVESIKKIEYFVPINPISKEKGKDEEMSFLTISTGDKEVFLPVYTDLGEFNKGPENKSKNYINLTFKEVVNITLMENDLNGFSINPYGSGLVVREDLVKYIENYNIFNKEMLRKNMNKKNLNHSLREFTKSNNDIRDKISFAIDIDEWYVPISNDKTNIETFKIENEDVLTLFTNEYEVLEFMKKTLGFCVMKIRPQQIFSLIANTPNFNISKISIDMCVTFNKEYVSEILNKIFPTYCKGQFEKIKQMKRDEEHFKSYIKNILTHPKLYLISFNEKLKDKNEELYLTYMDNNFKYGLVFTERKLANIYLQNDEFKNYKDYQFRIKEIDATSILNTFGNIEFISFNNELQVPIRLFKMVEESYNIYSIN